ncbi:translation initiation factor 4G, partial [Phenoliferia sp. Uapishka_3]
MAGAVTLQPENLPRRRNSPIGFTVDIPAIVIGTAPEADTDALTPTPSSHLSLGDSSSPHKPAQRWTPSFRDDPGNPEAQGKVTALLNKLSRTNFESISNQIGSVANKSAAEKDAKTLRLVVALLLEHATENILFSGVFAALARMLIERVSPHITDEGVKGPGGALIAGGGLFRKYLLDHCQERYEKRWKAAETEANSDDDDEKAEGGDVVSIPAPKEGGTLSKEYCAGAIHKVKRRNLGLYLFIGELYRVCILGERVLHECIKKLLVNTEDPKEEDVKILCRLFISVGKNLDNPKGKAHLDIYFNRMWQMAENQRSSSRLRFMIQVNTCNPPTMPSSGARRLTLRTTIRAS